jgi:hypothetical protein
VGREGGKKEEKIYREGVFQIGTAGQGSDAELRETERKRERERDTNSGEKSGLGEAGVSFPGSNGQKQALVLLGLYTEYLEYLLAGTKS